MVYSAKNTKNTFGYHLNIDIYHDYSNADYDMHHNNADAKPYDIYMGWPPLAEDSYWH